MATLKFTKEGSRYVAEVEVTSDFNLHIEREQGGGDLPSNKDNSDREIRFCKRF